MPTSNERTLPAGAAPRQRSSRLYWPAALLCAASVAGGAVLALHYPLSAPVALLLFAAVALGTWWRQQAWVVLLPALLPVVGFAPWTGWITFEELDQLVLAVAAGGYARRAWRAPAEAASRTGSSAVALIGLTVALFAASTLLAMVRGFADAGGFAFGWFQGYREPMNSVRLAKPFFAALLLWPLWSAAARDDAERAARQLSLGMMLGLLGASLAALWERLAFTGLLNFSTDYRTTALFWEMHVGGAALDGMLAVTFPFLVRELMVESSRRRWLLMAAVVPIAAYASLTTFSRAVYLAVPFGAVVVFMVQTRQPGMQAWSLRRSLATWLPALVLVAAFAWGAAAMFPSSGYRGLIALLGASALLLGLPAALRGIALPRLGVGVGFGLVLCAAAWGVAWGLSKGAYIAYAGAALFTLGMLVAQQRRLSPHSPILALGGFVAVLAGLALVAQHWGGSAALTAALPAIAVLPLLLLAALAAPSPLWPASWRWQASTTGAMLLAGSVVAAFGGGVYMTERFSTTASDFDDRIAHWRQGLSMLHGTQDLLLGRGLGRYVDQYAFASPPNQVPGDYRLRHEGDNRFVTLVAGTHLLGWGELQRLSQRIAVPEGPTFVQMDVRSDQAAVMHVEVCLKHLLYDGGCLVNRIRLPAKPNQWQTTKVRLDGNPLPTGPWYAPRMVMFSVASENPGVRVDIDNLSLMGVDQRNQLANGDFAADLSRWFMTSDRHHMPWHMKNIVAHVVFDQGLAGLALWSVLVVGALTRLTLTAARAHPLAPGVAGGLAGFLLVGMFDSLLDVPRVAFLFYFLVLLGLTLQPPRHRPPGAPAA